MPPRKRQRPNPATLSSSSLPTTALSPETSLSLASSASAQQASDQKRPPQPGSSSDHKPSDASLRVKEVKKKISISHHLPSRRGPLDLDGQILTERNRFGKPTAGTQRGRSPQRPQPLRRSLGRTFWETLLDPGTRLISLDLTRSEAKTTRISPIAPTQLRRLHHFRPSRAVHLPTRKQKRTSQQILYIPEGKILGLRDLLRKCPRFLKQSRLVSSSKPRSPSPLRSPNLGWRFLQAKVHKQPMLQMLHRDKRPQQGGSAGGLELHLPNLLLNLRQIPKR